MTTLLERAARGDASGDEPVTEPVTEPFNVIDTRGKAQPVGMILNGLWGGLARYFGGVNRKIATLEARLAEVEGKGIVYRGIYQRAQAQEYKRGDVVTAAGSMWVALVDNPPDLVPGASGWQCCCKAGRDGRDRDRPRDGDPGR